MSEERLKEIKDSIELQKNITMIRNYDRTFINEEIELYNEVIRLREENNQLDDIRNANYLSWQDSVARINEAIEYINKHSDNGNCFMEWFEIDYLLNILRGNDNEQ